MAQNEWASLAQGTLEMVSKAYSAIPGSGILLRYIKASNQNDPFRFFLELCLVGFMVWYFVAKRYKPGQNEVQLTEEEIQELCDEWEPEPLVPELTEFQKQELEKVPIIVGQAGLKVKGVDGKERLNFASYNFLSVMNSDAIKEKAVETLRKYGVGSCGPPGFYGTLDVHLELEEKLAAFIGTEAAIIYAQGFSCISSAIPAFAKRGDVIVADEGCNFAIQKGVQISRSQVKWFKHNDMKDLERVLAEVAVSQAKSKKLTRRFIIVEGLYVNYGDMCPLPEILLLKEKYKFRAIVEESMSFGVLGPRGAGVTDYFGIPATQVDIIVASLSNSLAASGGFCAGSSEIAEHQRLSGQAYTFSASLPAILAVSAIEAIKYLESHPDVLVRMNENAVLMRQCLDKISALLPGTPITLSGDEQSPFFHIQLSLKTGVREDDERILQEIVDAAAKDGLLITRSKYVISQERFPPPASIRVAVSAGFTKRDVEKAGNTIRECIRRVIKLRVK